jgi:hypothetical protein
MSTFTDDAKALWSHIIGTTTLPQAVSVITAVTTGLHDVAQGDSQSVLASIETNSPDTFKLIETIAEDAASLIGGPLAGMGVGLAIQLLAMSHKMTPDEEKTWFDFQTSAEGRN